MHDSFCNEQFLAELLGAMGRVQRYVAAHVSNPADAADIAQESLTRTIERACEADIVRPEFYVLTVARNLVADRYRNKALGPHGAVEEDLVCPAPLADQHIAHRQRLDAFAAALVVMPALRRDVFVRRRLHGESREEIAAALGLSEEAVKKHISRALAQLARALAAEDDVVAEAGWEEPSDW